MVLRGFVGVLRGFGLFALELCLRACVLACLLAGGVTWVCGGVTWV